MINIKTTEELERLKEGGKLLASILNTLSQQVRPGVALSDLEKEARRLIKEAGGVPSFLNYRPANQSLAPFPSALCASVNDEIVHGTAARGLKLKAGDIVGLDLGLKYKSLFTDMAVTVPVGSVSAEATKLIEVTKKSLETGLRNVRAGNYTGD